MSNYIISLHHTNPKDDYLTLWRPEDKGYCYSLGQAGVYESPKKGYHDSEDNTPIPLKQAEELSILIDYEGKGKRQMIPNSPAIHKALGLRRGRHCLKLQKPEKVSRKEVSHV